MYQYKYMYVYVCVCVLNKLIKSEKKKNMKMVTTPRPWVHLSWALCF
jgi:hypothetical protein